MFGVGDKPPFPPALKSMIALLKLKMPTVPVSEDVPKVRPITFMTVDRAGGDEIADGYINAPLFIFQCYALDAGSAEELAELLLSVLKSAQFTRYGDVQFRYFTLAGGPKNFPDPDVPSHRRWQFSGTFTLN